MKTLLVALLLAPALLRAQSILQSLPVDSVSGKVSYSAIVQMPGATKAQLYSRARGWAATEFRSAKDVLQLDDKEAGEIIAKGFVSRASFNSVTDFWRTIKVYAKDGKYKYEITDFIVRGPAVRFASQGVFEKEVEIASGHGKMKEPKGNYKFLLDGVAETAEAEVSSLRNAMAKPSGSEF